MKMTFKLIELGLLNLCLDMGHVGPYQQPLCTLNTSEIMIIKKQFEKN